MTKPESLSALGFWIRADVPLISMEVSIHGRGRLLEPGWALMRAMKFISAVAAPLPLATALCLTPESSRQ